MNRIDFVGVGLVSLAVVFAASALTGFFVLRGAAMRAASEVAEEEAKRTVEKIMREKGPQIVTEAISAKPAILYGIVSRSMEAASRNDDGVSAQDAAAIAESIEENADDRSS